jgi:hypothetical protein
MGISLAGKVAIITGASSGIGLAMLPGEKGAGLRRAQLCGSHPSTSLNNKSAGLRRAQLCDSHPSTSLNNKSAGLRREQLCDSRSSRALKRRAALCAIRHDEFTV